MLPSKGVKRVAHLLILTGVVALTTATFSLASKFIQSNFSGIEVVSPTIAAIRERGYLKCEISNEVEGLATRDYEAEETGEELTNLTADDISEGFFRHANGLEADICKSIAIAVLGDVNAVAFIVSGSNRVQRMRAVVKGERDILFRSSIYHHINKLESVNYSEVYFLEPVVLASRQIEEDPTSESYSSIRVCTTGYNLPGLATRRFSDEHQLNWDIITDNPDTEERYESFHNLIDAYSEGQCEGFTGKWSLLQKHVIKNKNHKLEGTQLHALGPNYLLPHTAIVNNSDNRWLDVVNAVLWTLINSDLRGFSKTGNTEYTRERLWSALELDSSNAAKIISEVGNYREIFERNLGDIAPISEVNRHYMFKAGKLFAPF